MPLKRNFIYWIDKRRWKYIFLLASLDEAARLKVSGVGLRTIALLVIVIFCP